MGVSNGGDQVKRAIECFPDAFAGGIDWEGPVWRAEGPNLIGELPVALRYFDAYAEGGFDPDSREADAIRGAGFPPDLIEAIGGQKVSLWQLHRDAFWELAQHVYVRKLDPAYFAGTAVPTFTDLVAYDFVGRSSQITAQLRKPLFGCSIENSGIVRKPLISVHGTLDALIPLKGHALPYQAKVEAAGYGDNYRLYQIENGTHLDSFKALLPSVELIQPHAHRAFDLLEAWVERGVIPPPSQLVARGTML